MLKILLISLIFEKLIDGGVVISPSPSASNFLVTGPNENVKDGDKQSLNEFVRFHHAIDQKPIPLKDIQRSKNSSNTLKNVQSIAKNTRNKRSFYAYSSTNYQIPQFQGIDTWKPSYYPLQHPYYVPVFGFNERLPFYIPNVPFYIPKEKPFVGPTYLPPKGDTTVKPMENSTTMPFDNRFGNGDGDDGDRPIWDSGESSATKVPFIIPTRKPTANAPKTFPPLVHKDTNINNSPSSNVIPTDKQSIKPPIGPSRCVWAIISCCSTSSKDISYNCFEQLGCSGPFWDVSPCETDYAKAAIQSALNYYNSRT